MVANNSHGSSCPQAKLNKPSITLVYNGGGEQEIKQQLHQLEQNRPHCVAYNRHRRRSRQNISLPSSNELISISVFVIFFSLHIGHVINTGLTNLDLLLGVLQRFQANACEGEAIKMECPANSFVYIDSWNYGPLNRSQIEQESHKINSTNNEYICSHQLNNNDNNNSLSQTSYSCSPDEAKSLRVSLGNRLRTNCKMRSNCSVELSPKSLGIDAGLCQSSEKKLAQVTYKCRPASFLNSLSCENSVISLSCPLEDQKLVILEVFHGALSRETVPECNDIVRQRKAATNQNDKVCSSAFTLSRVMKFCHGQRECKVTVNTESLGKTSCPVSVVTHAKITYACVAEKAIKAAHLIYHQSQRNSSVTTTKHLIKTITPQTYSETAPSSSMTDTNTISQWNNTTQLADHNNSIMQQQPSSTNKNDLGVMEQHLDGLNIASGNVGPMTDIEVQINTMGDGTNRHDNVLNNYIAAASRIEQNSVINLSANLTSTTTTTTNQSSGEMSQLAPKYTTVDDLMIVNSKSNNKYSVARNSAPNFFTWLSDWWRDNIRFTVGGDDEIITNAFKETKGATIKNQSDLHRLVSMVRTKWPYGLVACFLIVVIGIIYISRLSSSGNNNRLRDDGKAATAAGPGNIKKSLALGSESMSSGSHELCDLKLACINNNNNNNKDTVMRRWFNRGGSCGSRQAIKQKGAGTAYTTANCGKVQDSCSENYSCGEYCDQTDDDDGFDPVSSSRRFSTQQRSKRAKHLLHKRQFVKTLMPQSAAGSGGGGGAGDYFMPSLDTGRDSTPTTLNTLNMGLNTGSSTINSGTSQHDTNSLATSITVASSNNYMTSATNNNNNVATHLHYPANTITFCQHNNHHHHHHNRHSQNGTLTFLHDNLDNQQQLKGVDQHCQHHHQQHYMAAQQAPYSFHLDDDLDNDSVGNGGGAIAGDNNYQQLGGSQYSCLPLKKHHHHHHHHVVPMEAPCLNEDVANINCLVLEQQAIDDGHKTLKHMKRAISNTQFSTGSTATTATCGVVVVAPDGNTTTNRCCSSVIGDTASATDANNPIVTTNIPTANNQWY